MLNPFVCGTFHHQEEDGGACSSPRKSKRKGNNPYSNRGLDKFSALLADLNERRQKVYSQMSPQDISIVRFAYSSNDDFVPIVVKVKNKEQKKHKSEELRVRHFTPFLEQLEKPNEATVEERKQPKLESHKKNYGFSWNMLKRPSFYVPLVMVLILVFLTVFGRSFATLCTCVMWYAVPILSGDSSNPRKLKKKDNNSEKKMVKTDQGLLSPRKHGHQKSW
ncbi:uncharacterized protein LOC113866363 [Abrus precatorius]|uniref:Uncharacterized protein LOC113866363 n=1 Tax=Abrus precatorius TaxID=3816 RepID=A0A8B8LKX8_ABRPR|nr:uncharacterized protein LOC113866363 [Abrus precatorius]